MELGKEAMQFTNNKEYFLAAWILSPEHALKSSSLFIMHSASLRSLLFVKPLLNSCFTLILCSGHLKMVKHISSCFNTWKKMRICLLNNILYAFILFKISRECQILPYSGSLFRKNPKLSGKISLSQILYNFMPPSLALAPGNLASWKIKSSFVSCLSSGWEMDEHIPALKHLIFFCCCAGNLSREWG